MLTNSRGVFDTTPARVPARADAGAGQGPAGHAARPGSATSGSIACWSRSRAGARSSSAPAPSRAPPAGCCGRWAWRSRWSAAREREGEPGEGRIRAVADLHRAAAVGRLAHRAGAAHAADARAHRRRRAGGCCPRGARLVNIGRGPTVVEDALIEALRSGASGRRRARRLRARAAAAGEPAVGHAQRHRLAPHRWRRGRHPARLRRGLPGQPASATSPASRCENVVDKRLGFVPGPTPSARLSGR